MSSEIQNNYASLIVTIGSPLNEGRKRAFERINTMLVETNWEIGLHIVEFEQGGSDRAQYGAELLLRLSKDLTSRYGKGFSRSNLTYMRRFYLVFPKGETLSHKLTWSIPNIFPINCLSAVTSSICQTVTNLNANCKE